MKLGSLQEKNEYQWLPPGKGVDWTEGLLVGRLWCLDLYLNYMNISYSIMRAHTHTHTHMHTHTHAD